MENTNGQFIIEDRQGAMEFIGSFGRYARSGIYKITTDTMMEKTEEVIVSNYEKPCIVRKSNMIENKIFIVNDKTVIDHILENKVFYQLLYIQVMNVQSDIEEAVERLEKIIEPLEKEGYRLSGFINRTISDLNKKSTDREEVYKLMREVDEHLVYRGIPFVTLGIYENEIDSEFDYGVTPYLDLGGFEKLGVDRVKKTKEFIKNFIENYNDFMWCVWDEEPLEYFDYCIGYLSSHVDSCKLWIKDGFLFRQKIRDSFDYNWPIEKYNIHSKEDVEKLEKVLQPDIRLINYSNAYRTQE